MHDEYRDLLFLIISIFIVIITTTIIIGLNMKGDRTKVHTLISETFPK